MARTSEGAALTIRHQQLQLALTRTTMAQLLRLWVAFDPARAVTFDPVIAAAALVVRAANQTSAGLAAAYYGGFRIAEGLRDAIPARLAVVPVTERVEGLLRGSAITGMLSARNAGRPPAAERDAAFVQLSGQATSLVLGGGRRTLMAAADADPDARGRIQRITTGDACAFCAMLASRGPVYQATFEAHDHDACVPEIVYPGSALPASSAAYRSTWNQATAGLSGGDAFRAFRAALTPSPVTGAAA